MAGGDGAGVRGGVSVVNLTLISVPPIGWSSAVCFVDYADGTGGLRQEVLNAYPPSPRGDRLRRLRIESRRTHRDAAPLLGLSVVELSKLEVGKLTLSDADWAAAERVLTEGRT